MKKPRKSRAVVLSRVRDAERVRNIVGRIVNPYHSLSIIQDDATKFRANLFLNGFDAALAMLREIA